MAVQEVAAMTDTLRVRASETPRLVQLREQHAATVRIDGHVDEIPRMIGEAFSLASEAIARSGAVIAGPPFARYDAIDEGFHADAGFPFTGSIEPTARVKETILPAGRAVTLRHTGPYEEISAAWERGMAWIGEHGLIVRGPGWESYLTGPAEPGPPVTEIVWPVR
jgi:effector-binding domain-containing protein